MKKLLPVFASTSTLLAILGIILFVMPGYSVSATVLGNTSVTNYSIYNLIFGCDLTDNTVSVGLLIAFILTIIAILVGIVVSYLFFMKKKKNSTLPSLLALGQIVAVLASAILIFCLLPLTGLSTGSVDYSILKGSASLGSGVILSGIILILSGLFMIPAALKPILKK
ncbi:MAG: hypothetical protein WCR67_00870 [Bacilli bacterium]